MRNDHVSVVHKYLKHQHQHMPYLRSKVIGNEDLVSKDNAA